MRLLLKPLFAVASSGSAGEDKPEQASPLAHSLRGYCSPGVYTRERSYSLGGVLPGRISPSLSPPRARSLEPTSPPSRALQETDR